MRLRTKPFVVLGMTVAFALMAGCSSGGDNASPPTSTGGAVSSGADSSSPSSSASSQAPKVAKPLDAANMVKTPCSALTPGDVVALHIVNAASAPRVDAVGSQCTWSGDSGGGISVGW